MVELFLARHGQTEENVAKVLQGHMPGHLTELGKYQMSDVKKQLVGIVPDVVISSDLLRAYESALILYPDYKIISTPLLRERDWGELTGTSIENLKGSQSFPPSVETIESMTTRAKDFLDFLDRNYVGQTIVAVGHGLFNRFVLASAAGCSYRDIPRMANSEIRKLSYVLPSETTSLNETRIDEASAD